jgi:hypothetical protein
MNGASTSPPVYSIAIAVTGPPCAWLGGVLYRQPVQQ